MYSEFFNKNEGKNVSVTMVDGEVFTGVLYGYVSAVDNEPDPESIVIDRGELTELLTEEIKMIEVL